MYPDQKVYSDPDFIDFINKCAAMDKDSWDIFIHKYHNLIVNYVIRTLIRYNYGKITYEDFELECSREKMIEGIEDITSRIYLALLDRRCRRLRNFRGINERSFGAYLREVSFHISIDYMREQINFIELEQIQDKASYDPYEKLDKQELFHLARKIKKDLPKRHSFLFYLLYEEELEIPVIAEIMDLNLNAIHQLKFRTINNFIRIAKQRDLFDELKQFAYSLRGIHVILSILFFNPFCQHSAYSRQALSVYLYSELVGKTKRAFMDIPDISLSFE